jgi:hypothetical protein
VVFLVAVGANTVAHHFIDGPRAVRASAVATGEPKAHESNTPKPAYNLPGYRSAITGAESQAFVSALNKMRSDNRRYDFKAAVGDAPRLVAAASGWLSVLSRTDPPPAYRLNKLRYMSAATLGRRAGWAMSSGLQAADLGKIEYGARLTNRARWVLSQIPASAPQGS